MLSKHRNNMNNNNLSTIAIFKCNLIYTFIYRANITLNKHYCGWSYHYRYLNHSWLSVRTLLITNHYFNDYLACGFHSTRYFQLNIYGVQKLPYRVNQLQFFADSKALCKPDILCSVDVRMVFKKRNTGLFISGYSSAIHRRGSFYDFKV
jgi:hypothetical protein